MGCQKAAQESANTNRKTIKGMKVGNNAGSFFRNYRIIHEIGGAQVKPRPEYAREALNDQ